MTDLINDARNSIIILSGEGENGTYSRYTGKRTARAINMRLTRERANGDRWARVYVNDASMILDFLGEQDAYRYYELDTKLDICGIRDIPIEQLNDFR